MIEITVPGVGRLEENLRALPAELRREQRQEIAAAAEIVRAEVVRRIHSPGGHAAKGIKVRVSGSGLDVVAKILPANRQAIFTQRSRGAGTTPPPMKAARAIARRYGIPVAKARGIAVMIGRRGTVGHPVMAAALAATRGHVEQLFRQALERIAAKAAQL